MHKYLFTLFFLITVLTASFPAAAGNYKEVVNTGSWNIAQLDTILASASGISDPPSRIDFLSKQFSGVPYKSATLVGSPQRHEELVINLAGVDCFTFIDYVEAMRRSGSFAAFKENLRKVRYQSGVVDYKKRNHFFTDWIVFNSDFIDDVTAQIGAGKSQKTVKMLNAGENGEPLLPGISAKKRELDYIPSEAIDKRLLDRLQTGDYLGIYSNRNDLDVSHVGIVIRKGADLFYRHASSQEKFRKVVDADLKTYLLHKPGVVILRPIGNDKSKLSLRASDPGAALGVVHERNAFLKRSREKIASGNVVALAMTAEERHCESAVADAAVSAYSAHKRKKFLMRSGSDVPAR